MVISDFWDIFLILDLFHHWPSKHRFIALANILAFSRANLNKDLVTPTVIEAVAIVLAYTV